MKESLMNIKKIIKIATGRDIDIHPDVPINYIMKKGISYSFGLINGFIRGIGLGKRGARFFIGKGVSIFAKHKIYIENNVRIGKNSSFSEFCLFGAAGGITIGDDVIAGQNVRFHSENHNYDDVDKLIREQGVNRKGISVGNNCWIGAGAVFLDGSSIGSGCIVAANSVVTKHFPDNVIIGGVPAKILKKRL